MRPTLYQGLSCGIVAVTLGLACVASAPGSALAGGPVDDGVAPVQTTTRPKPSAPKLPRLEIEDAVKRAYRWAREQEEPRVARFWSVPEPDELGSPGVLCFVEFEDGSLGLYLASRVAPERDQRLQLPKSQMAALEEAAVRSKGRQ